MLKRVMNIVTFFWGMWIIASILLVIGEFYFELITFDAFKFIKGSFELLAMIIISGLCITILNYIFFNKLTLWHKQKKTID
jgi:hypothetical protein